jgi:hypothetical protein
VRWFFPLLSLGLIACSSAEPTPPVTPAPLLSPPVVAPVAPVTPLSPATATAEPSSEPAAEPPPFVSACNEQAPLAELIRSAYAYDPKAPPAENARRKALHQQAIAWRTKRYGYVDGFGDPTLNTHIPKELSAGGTFFGIPIRMNKRVLAALSCVETDIARSCNAGTETPYIPHKLDGIRFRNTFHNGEVTNHAYGIAIDVDWDTNPCCGCVAPLSNDARCKQPMTAYERTNLPKCWIDTFERYGFYWLGHDVLEDTMHFEFLADPSKIVRSG